jgi:hypothetical protein
MTQEDNDKKPRTLGLSPAQVAGSALAAMSVAFFASWAGTAGTIIGAAVGSVIATVGAATYTWSLQRTSAAARRTAELVRQRALATSAFPRPAQRPPSHDGGPPEVSEDLSDEEPTVEPQPRRWDLPWVKVALASLAVMVAGMAGITAVEAVTGKPIASLLGRDDGTGTTVGHVVGSDNGSTRQQSPTKKSPSTPQPTPSQEPQPQPQQPEPSTTPEPTTPSTTPDVPVPVPSQTPDEGGTQP